MGDNIDFKTLRELVENSLPEMKAKDANPDFINAVFNAVGNHLRIKLIEASLENKPFGKAEALVATQELFAIHGEKLRDAGIEAPGLIRAITDKDATATPAIENGISNFERVASWAYTCEKAYLRNAQETLHQNVQELVRDLKETDVDINDAITYYELKKMANVSGDFKDFLSKSIAGELQNNVAPLQPDDLTGQAVNDIRQFGISSQGKDKNLIIEIPNSIHRNQESQVIIADKNWAVDETSNKVIAVHLALGDHAGIKLEFYNIKSLGEPGKFMYTTPRNISGEDAKLTLEHATQEVLHMNATERKVFEQKVDQIYGEMQLSMEKRQPAAASAPDLGLKL